MTTPNFYAEHIERMVQGYAELAQIDVAKQYVWETINAMAGIDPPLWGQLPDMVVARAKEVKHARISG